MFFNIMEQLEFNSFLLHLGNELQSNEFEALKFVLKGYVTSSKCEEMIQVFKYFEEMERLLLLSPTNLLVLKIALGSIGRLDLVKKIEGKEEYFATLIRETINDDNSLDRKDCALVCDDIKEAAVHLAEFFPRSGQSTSEMHKELKLIGNEEEDMDFQLQEIVEELQASAEEDQMTLVTAEPAFPVMSSLLTVETEAAPLLQTDKVKHKVLGSHKVKKNLLEYKTEQKNPCRETVSDGNQLKDSGTTSKTPDKMKTAVTTGATSLHAIMPPSFSSVNKLDDDAVTDGGEKGNKGNLRAGFNKLDGETTMNSSKQVPESDSCGSKDQMFPVDSSPLLTSYEAPSTDSSQLQLRSYKKKGYSVAIINGSLCECTSEKGVVMMENGTTFAIAITNSNDYAAEVDVMFGGRYLGLWSVDAQQTAPLIIEGSAWEKGQLTFTSDSPECMPSSNVHPVDGVESSGKIELEFKPEAMAFFVEHVRSEKKHEVLLTGFKEATVDDLKEEINRTLWECLGIVSCLIRNGQVLEEQNTVRSYSLKDGDIIQVLTNEEPMSVEPLGLDAFTIRVDPRHDSCKRVMDAIAGKMCVPIKKQRLQFNGEDLKETDSLATMFLKSKKPVIKVVTDRNINIIVHLPSQEVKKFSIAWFATVDELKKELQLPQTDAILKLDHKEICGSGSKQLIDLGMKNGSEVTVASAQQKENRAPATHRGVKMSSLRKPATTRGFGGFGDFEFHAPVSNTRGFSSGSRASPDPLGEYENSDDMEEDAQLTIQRNDLPAGLREGTCFLHGEELFANQFEVDTLERKFSKDKLKAVTLIIQLCSRSTVEAY